MLLDWWFEPLQHPELMEATIKHITDLAACFDWSIEISINHWTQKEDAPGTREEASAIIHSTAFLDSLGLVWRGTLLHKSIYHRNMLQLFAMEFVMESRALLPPALGADNSRFTNVLQEQRQICAVYSTLNTIILSSPNISPVLPLREALRATTRTMIRPCPWLKLTQRRNEMPYYLGDVQQKYTIATKDFPRPVEYICISYSWGRWRVPVEQPDAFTTIPGVDWKVPRNTLFDVEKLPDEFSRVLITKAIFGLISS